MYICKSPAYCRSVYVEFVFIFKVHVFLHLGRWSAKTGGILSGPFTLQWLSVGLEARLPVNAVQLNDLLLEIIDDSGGSGSLIGSGRVAIHSLLGNSS